VPFVYLSPPTDQPVGLFNTIPVLGATAWVAPVWIGLPVQWCGLVYADALYWLAPHDPDGPWRQIADGIAVSGIQHTWPSTDTERQGLLPDIFRLEAQVRDGPAINPATVFLPALRFFRQPQVYDVRVFRRAGLIVHAPGEVVYAEESPEGVKFTVAGWVATPYEVLLNGVETVGELRINGEIASIEAPHQFDRAAARVILRLEGKSHVELRLRP
jgi:hypothetical protein